MDALGELENSQQDGITTSSTNTRSGESTIAHVSLSITDLQTGRNIFDPETYTYNRESLSDDEERSNWVVKSVASRLPFMLKRIQGSDRDFHALDDLSDHDALSVGTIIVGDASGKAIQKHEHRFEVRIISVQDAMAGSLHSPNSHSLNNQGMLQENILLRHIAIQYV